MNPWEGKNLIVYATSIILIPTSFIYNSYRDSNHLHNIINVTDGGIPTEAGTQVTLQHVLVFFTGADREPPLGFPTKASLEFLKAGDVLATASTCDLIL